MEEGAIVQCSLIKVLSKIQFGTFLNGDNEMWIIDSNLPFSSNELLLVCFGFGHPAQNFQVLVFTSIKICHKFCKFEEPSLTYFPPAKSWQWCLVERLQALDQVGIQRLRLSLFFNDKKLILKLF